MAYSTKYSDVTDPTVERSDAYWPFLRYADIVLIYAEAMCELGSGVDSEAIKALNAIPVSYTHLTLPTIYSV